MQPLFVDTTGREVPAPDFGGAAVADTHAHLDMLDDPAGALARAARAGVGLIATVADVSEDAWRTYDSLPAWLCGAQELLDSDGVAAPLPQVRVILGCHPHNAKAWGAETEAEFRRLVADPLTCGVGELGLDYHYDHSPREVQRDAMRAHLALASEFGMPATIHLREAHADGLAVLREVGVPSAGAILHCYTLGPETMRDFLDLGCHVSFAGSVTFKKAEEIRDAVRGVPSGRLLTETDCPFMSPEPFRGTTNEPALVVFTAERMAQARDVPLAAFAAETFSAALKIFARGEA
jgi:TatD DNase family protein